MTALLASPHLAPMIFGIKWMDPDWLLSEFGSSLIWLSLVIVFIECGLFFPFLPGDTLLFALGLFIAGGQIHILGIDAPFVELVVAIVMLTTAAVLGNVCGYEIGRAIGPPLYNRDGRILKRKYFDETTAFFDKHGNKALVIGRFVPFVRTYITVVAGVTRMDRRRFFFWSLVGAAIWVTSITTLGYFLGNVPGRPVPVREHRLRDLRDPALHRDPDRLRGDQAAPATPRRAERRPGADRRSRGVSRELSRAAPW